MAIRAVWVDPNNTQALLSTAPDNRAQYMLTKLGTGTLTCHLKSGSTTYLTGIVPAGSLSVVSNKLTCNVVLTSISGSGGSPDANAYWEITNGNDYIRSKVGANEFIIVNPTIIDSSHAQRLILSLGPNTTIPTPPSDYTPGTNESVVLYSGRMTVPKSFFGINGLSTPYYNIGVIDPVAYSTNTWHGGWGSGVGSQTATNLSGWYEGGRGSMLQLMILNYTKTSGWTDSDYDFTEADKYVNFWYSGTPISGKGGNMAGPGGIKVIMNCEVNMSGSDKPFGSAGALFPSISPARLKDLMHRVILRYAGKIESFETANEPPTQSGATVLFPMSPATEPYVTDNWYTQAWWSSGAQCAQAVRVYKQAINSSSDPSIPLYGGHFLNPEKRIQYCMAGYLNSNASGGLDIGDGSGTGTGTTLKDWLSGIGIHGYSNDRGNGKYGYNLDPGWGGDGSYTAMKDFKAACNAVAPSLPIRCTEVMLRDTTGATVWAYDDEAFWGWFERVGSYLALGLNKAVDFVPSQNGTYATYDSAEYRRKWAALSTWLQAMDIIRIVITTSNTIKFTRLDGATLETYGAL